MVDPKRLLERGGLASELLRAGSEEQPSTDALRKTALAVGAGAAVASSAGVANGAGAATASIAGGSTIVKAVPLTFAFAVKWLAIGTVGGLVSVAAASKIVPSAGIPPGIDHGQVVIATPYGTAMPPAPAASSPPSAFAGMPSPIGLPPRLRAADARLTAPTLPTVQSTANAAERLVPEPSPSVPQVEEHASVAVERHVVQRDPTGRRPLHHSDPSRPLREQQPSPPEPNAEPPPTPHAARPKEDRSWPLAAEIAFVDRGWKRMQEGGYADALTLLGSYEKQYPETRLHPEVLFLRMESENKLGQAGNAAATARYIISIYPKSAQASRARELLAAVRAPNR